MKVDYGYNFIRITCVEADISDNKITFPEDPIFGKYPIIVYCDDTGTLYTGAYDDGDVTLSEYGSGSGGGGGTSDAVYIPVDIDYTDPQDPQVTCEISGTTILGYITAGKTVCLVYTDDQHFKFLYVLVGYGSTTIKFSYVDYEFVSTISITMQGADPDILLYKEYTFE